MTDPIVIVVDGEPKPKGSMTAFLVGGKIKMTEGRGASGKASVKWRATVAKAAREQYDGELLTGPLTIDMTFRIGRPKTVDRGYPCVQPDWDKLARNVGDALTGAVYVDDALVVGAVVRKLYAERLAPGCTIVVKPVE